MDIEDGGPAFPPSSFLQGTGMSLRDYFAGQALLIVNGSGPNAADATAKQAYALADAMIRARKEG